MGDCPQFQLMPQMVPIYRPQPPSAAFSMPGQPIFPMPAHFGYPSIAWPPIHHYPPTPQPAYHTEEEDEYNNNGQPIYNNANAAVDDSHQEPQQTPQRPHRQTYTRSVSNKFDTRHEEFRKYLEEVGILSTFTNILAEMYQDPLRPSDPLGYIRDKLCSSRSEAIELANLRHWCEQYQNKTMRLEKELKDVIKRLRKYESYNSDDSLFSENLSDNNCTTCVLDAAKQGHILSKSEDSSVHEQVKQNN
ncbi:uncharacterized protein LOC126843086 [Adelges cooleyi]|uniref:uncharacterized protein LOC126843086 n=1 Tax=Adelges cooleyi TaxID=133065 RepID=UPI0021802015|nr:uncharacterized protein LOC126843086 [Adelges cooleyi]